MTDKELLELAAKAAGIELIEWDWNPLTDDGDALRLAVKLGLIVEVSQQDSWTFISYTCCDSKPSVSEKHHADACAATRRAIVRAAAEIGKGLK